MKSMETRYWDALYFESSSWGIQKEMTSGPIGFTMTLKKCEGTATPLPIDLAPAVRRRR